MRVRTKLWVLATLVWSALAHATPFVSIVQDPLPPSGIEQINIGNDLSAQILHTDDAFYQVYPPDGTLGDYGTLAVVDGERYYPDFHNHSMGSYVFRSSTAFGTKIYSPISQSPVEGSGTPEDPLRVVTVVGLGTTGITISQMDSFINGNEFYRTDITVINSAADEKPIKLYRLMDCYMGGSDLGYGAIYGGSPACSTTPDNEDQGRILMLTPLTAGSFYEQIGLGGASFPYNNLNYTNSCQGCGPSAVYTDNGIGINWDVVLPAQSSMTFSHYTSFSPSGRLPLTVNKSASPATVQAGGEIAYTVTIDNPNDAGVLVSNLLDTLPPGFELIPGSATGALTADPTGLGSLQWDAGFNAVGSGITTFSYRVRVLESVAPGEYASDLSGQSADGYSFYPAAAVAPVTVTASSGGGHSAIDATPVPISSIGLLLALGLGTAAAFQFSRRRK